MTAAPHSLSPSHFIFWTLRKEGYIGITLGEREGRGYASAAPSVRPVRYTQLRLIGGEIGFETLRGGRREGFVWTVNHFYLWKEGYQLDLERGKVIEERTESKTQFPVSIYSGRRENPRCHLADQFPDGRRRRRLMKIRSCNSLFWRENYRRDRSTEERERTGERGQSSSRRWHNGRSKGGKRWRKKGQEWSRFTSTAGKVIPSIAPFLLSKSDSYFSAHAYNEETRHSNLEWRKKIDHWGIWLLVNVLIPI